MANGPVVNYIDNDGTLWHIPSADFADGTGEMFRSETQDWVTSEISDAFVKTLSPVKLTN